MGYSEVVNLCKKELRYYKTAFTATKKYSFGKRNKDKKFLVLKSYDKRWGLYSTILLLLPFMDWARKRGYIPVVDVASSNAPLLQDEKKRKRENSWEYYYKQPSEEISLAEVYQSKNVRVLEKYYVMKTAPDWNAFMPAPGEELERWSRIIKRNIHLNDGLAEKVKTEKGKIFKNANKVLGVGIRAGYRYGMMKNDAMFNHHPKCATCEEYIAIIERKMDEWNCDAIFLAIDDREYWEKFVKHFGMKCRYVDRRLHHYFKGDRPVESLDELFVEYGGRRNDTRKKNEEYIVETHILAQCHALYAGIGGGTEFAYFMNGGRYENIEIYYEGIYEGVGNKEHSTSERKK